jgi:hypothetical protein
MKIVAFIVGFATIAAVVAHRIAAGDAEPIGAEASLYMFGLFLVVLCTPSFAMSSAQRSIPAAPLVAALIGAICSGVFYGVLVLVFPALPLGVAVLISGIGAVATSAALPRLFRPAPNNSFKPKPLRGSA